MHVVKITALDGRSARKQFVRCLGSWAAPCMRKFHGKDVRGSWSVTEVDPKKDITLTHKTHLKENVTPLGVRMEEREVSLMSFSLTTNACKHDQTFKKMQDEELVADGNERSAFMFTDDITKEHLMVRELAERRRRALRSTEKKVTFLEGRIERLQKKTLKHRDELRRAGKL